MHSLENAELETRREWLREEISRPKYKVLERLILSDRKPLGVKKIELRKFAVGFLSFVDVEKVGYVWVASASCRLTGFKIWVHRTNQIFEQEAGIEEQEVQN